MTIIIASLALFVSLIALWMAGANSKKIEGGHNELKSLINVDIDKAKKDGDSLGGIFEVVVSGLPVGLGSHAQADKKLDGLIAGAMMSVQAIKGVEIGIGFEEGRRPGSQVHDEIFYGNMEGECPRFTGEADQSGRTGTVPGKMGFFRKTNHAGGIEGGMTNGKDVVVRAVMKPIPTLYKPLMSVDMCTKEPFEASIERSDVCAVPAAAVIGEAVVAFEIAKAFLDKFGGDSMEEIRRNFDSYSEYVSRF